MAKRVKFPNDPDSPTPLNISDDCNLLPQYLELLQIFESLEENCPLNGQNLAQFLNLHSSCMENVEKLIELENDSTYFLPLLQLKKDLNEQKNNLHAPIEMSCTHSMEHPKLNSLKSPIDSKGKSKLTENEEFLATTMVTPCVKSLNDMIGLDEVKQTLKEAIMFPVKYPQLFHGQRKPWKKVLLYGPPGTGKTCIVHALAAETNVPLYNVSSADLLSKYIGESEKLIRTLFNTIIQNQFLSIILIDEVDSLCRKRTSDEPEYLRRVKTELLTQIQLIDDSQALLLCATNCPWDIDPAFMRRFQKRIYIPLPNRQERHQIMLKYANGNEMNMNQNEWNYVLDKTNGFSGSDLATLINCVLYEPLRDLENTTSWSYTNEKTYVPCVENSSNSIHCTVDALETEKIQLRNIVLKDFQTALRRNPRTVSDQDLLKYNRFTLDN